MRVEQWEAASRGLAEPQDWADASPATDSNGVGDGEVAAVVFLMFSQKRFPEACAGRMLTAITWAFGNLSRMLATHVWMALAAASTRVSGVMNMLLSIIGTTSRSLSPSPLP